MIVVSSERNSVLSLTLTMNSAHTKLNLKRCFDGSPLWCITAAIAINNFNHFVYAD